MHKKIYFNSKPLFVTDTISEEINRYKGDKKTRFAENPDEESIQQILNGMETADAVAGILLDKNVEALFQQVARHFTLVQAAGGLVHTDKGNILLIFRRGKWDLPKGKLDEGEELDACAVREVEEETGLQHVQLEKPLCITYHTYYERAQHILKESHWYLMNTADNQVFTPQTDEDIEKCEWVNAKELAPYLENTHPSIIDVVKEGIKLLGETKQV